METYVLIHIQKYSLQYVKVIFSSDNSMEIIKFEELMNMPWVNLDKRINEIIEEEKSMKPYFFIICEDKNRLTKYNINKNRVYFISSYMAITNAMKYSSNNSLNPIKNGWVDLSSINYIEINGVLNELIEMIEHNRKYVLD